jgi:cell division cycle 14
VKLGWFSVSGFNLKEYEYYERVENGDLNWIIPHKFVAFSSPGEKEVDQEGHRVNTPKDYIPIFKKFNVTTVVRLNTKTYNAKDFKDAGIAHHDLYFHDGTTPTVDIINRFIELAEHEPNAIAVHCKAGLGRTGTLIGCYAIKHYHFNPAYFIGYIRICRPGSVLGPQQHFLIEMASRLLEQGADSPIFESVR